MSSTYRFVGERTFHHRGERLDAGDEVALSDVTYDLHRRYFEPVDAEDEADDTSESTPTESGEEEDASTVSDDGGDDTDEDDLADLSYRELQDRAGEYDDISGNQSADDLRSALREKREG